MIADNYGKRWTKDEEQLLVTMLKSGADLNEICTTLSRTRNGVLIRMQQLAAEAEKFNRTKQVIIENL